jgi:hypothetical protein
MTVAFCGPRTERAKLVAFYRLVRPAGPGWASVRAEARAGAAGSMASPDNMPRALLGWTLGCAFIYSALFGTGSFLYGHTAQGALWLAVFAASGFGVAGLLGRANG